jgi:outer membrane protein assembly factor BamA
MIRRSGILRLPVLLLPVLLLGACNVTKHLPKNEYLLVKNKFTIDNSKISADDLGGYLQQLPNDKLFGLFRTNIALYNMGSKGKDSKFKKWLRTKVGSAPVILDTSLVAISRKQMKLFLNNKGYFQSVVTDSIAYHKKKATAHFVIRSGQPYTFRSLKYLIPDTQLASYVFLDTSRSLIRTKANYDAYLLDDERTRITNNLLNQGYYHFNPGFIVFRLDSTLNKHQMDVLMEIINPVIPSLTGFGMVAQVPHKRYFINNIYIYPEFDNLGVDSLSYDTLVATYETPFKNRASITYYFLSNKKFRLKPRTMAQNVLVEPGKEYTLKDVTKTYSQLNGLQVFKYVSIGFEDVLAPPGSPYPDVIDCNIKLARSSGNAISFSTDATNSAGAFGMSGTVGYQNKNIFTGAQLLKFSVNATAQMQAGGGSSALFNTMEFGANVSLTFPQFLIPVKPERFSKEFKPKTILTLGYNFQSKLDPKYIRNMFNASFGYSWIQNEKLTHILNPIELLFVNVNPSPEFTRQLDSLQDQRLKSQYTSHVVAGLRYTLTFSNQKLKKGKDFFYIRSNLETGGNLIYGISSLLNSPKNADGSYMILGSPYAQYVRPDLDLRYYRTFRNTQSVVTRFYGGIAIPYGNSDAVPFEKAFMAGGANDLRGWKIGYLGPGTYNNDTSSQAFSQIGDIQLQVDLEYRFPISGFLKGALFTDIGNIWLLRESPDLPGGKFNFDTFYKQVGIDVGFGIRLDFDFFIFRLDPAIPVRVPSYLENNGWYFSQWQLKDIIWNFGIGYPF